MKTSVAEMVVVLIFGFVLGSLATQSTINSDIKNSVISIGMKDYKCKEIK